MINIIELNIVLKSKNLRGMGVETLKSTHPGLYLNCITVYEQHTCDIIFIFRALEINFYHSILPIQQMVLRHSIEQSNPTEFSLRKWTTNRAIKSNESLTKCYTKLICRQYRQLAVIKFNFYDGCLKLLFAQTLYTCAGKIYM